MSRAFAEAPGRKADASTTGEGGVTEVPYDDLPEGSKEWYRSRMRAALRAYRDEGTIIDMGPVSAS